MTGKLPDCPPDARQGHPYMWSPPDARQGHPYMWSFPTPPNGGVGRGKGASKYVGMPLAGIRHPISTKEQ
ncbi:MAG: hypothetical protein ACRDIV_23790 [Ktedonobacteraceae bacterium]